MIESSLPVPRKLGLVSIFRDVNVGGAAKVRRDDEGQGEAALHKVRRRDKPSRRELVVTTATRERDTTPFGSHVEERHACHACGHRIHAEPARG